MTPKENPATGLDRSIQVCIEAFLNEMKCIVGEVDSNTTIPEQQQQQRFRLPQVAIGYKLLLSMANLLYFRQVSLGRIIGVYGTELGIALPDSVSVPLLLLLLHELTSTIVRTHRMQSCTV